MITLMQWLYHFSFTLLGIRIDTNDFINTISNMLDFNYLKNNFVLWNAVETVNTALVPVGISLLTLFFLVSIIKMTQEGVERITWERIVLKASVFFMLVYFIQNSFSWFTTIANVVQNSIFDPVVTNLSLSTRSVTVSGITVSSDMLIKSIPEFLSSLCDEQGGVKKYLYAGVFVILAIPYMATIIMIISQVFLRAIKLLIYMMISPIPIALAAEGETFRGKAISFFMNFAGVCFEAVVIYIGLYVYSKGMTDIFLNAAMEEEFNVSAIIAIMFMNGLFTAIIGLSGQLSKEFFSRG